jgi:hypothetical protein
MKKILSITLLIAMCLSLSACGKKDEISSQDASTSKEKVEIQKDLMGWIKSGESVECAMTIEGGGKVTMMAKDEKIRIEGIPYISFTDIQSADIENTNGVSLSIGDWMYMWGKNGKEGMKFNVKEMEELGDTQGEEDESYDTWEDTVDGWEDDGVEYDCKKVKLADDLFSVPSNVEFADLGETMKGFTEMGKNFEKQFEEGNDINIDDLKDLLPEGMEIPEMD